MSRKGQISPRTVTLGLRQRAWWVMRRRICFTLPELLSTLADAGLAAALAAGFFLALGFLPLVWLR